MYYPNKRDINDWLDDKRREKGFNKINLYFLREFKQISAEFGRNNIIFYFMITNNIFDAHMLLKSGLRQRKFVRSVIDALKEYQIAENDIKVFKNGVSRLKERCRWVTKIMKENIRLTKYHLYFENGGYDDLVEFSMAKMSSFNENFENADALNVELMNKIEDYNSKHADEIEAYMASIADEIARVKAAEAKRKDYAKKEKEAARKAKELEQAEIREMKQWAKEQEKERRQIEKQDDYYYRLANGGAYLSE